MRLPVALVGMLPAFGLISTGPAAVRSGHPHPQLAGSWVFAVEETERKLPVGRSGRGGPEGRGPEGGRRTPGEVEGVAPLGRGILERGLAELLRPKQRLEIAQSDTMITLKDDAGWIRFLIPTGQRMREELGQGGPADIITRWKGNKLTTERMLDRGGVYRETFSLLGKTGQLLVETRYQTERTPRPIEGRRVYDRETGARTDPRDTGSSPRGGTGSRES